MRAESRPRAGDRVSLTSHDLPTGRPILKVEYQWTLNRTGVERLDEASVAELAKR